MMSLHVMDSTTPPKGWHLLGLHTPSMQSTGGPYASYWNAFLLPSATKLRQGYTCLSFCSQGGGCLPQCMLGYTPLGRHPPPRSTQPPGSTAPRSTHHLSRSTPPRRTHIPPQEAHSPRSTPSPPPGSIPPETHTTP